MSKLKISELLKELKCPCREEAGWAPSPPVRGRTPSRPPAWRRPAASAGPAGPRRPGAAAAPGASGAPAALALLPASAGRGSATFGLLVLPMERATLRARRPGGRGGQWRRNFHSDQKSKLTAWKTRPPAGRSQWDEKIRPPGGGGGARGANGATLWAEGRQAGSAANGTTGLARGRPRSQCLPLAASAAAPHVGPACGPGERFGG